MPYHISNCPLFLITTETQTVGRWGCCGRVTDLKACYFIIFFSHHGSDGAFMVTRFLVIFSPASPKKRLNADRLPVATGGCATLSAPIDINRSIRNTHPMPLLVKHMCLIHISASQGQRWGCCLLMGSVFIHH